MRNTQHAKTTGSRRRRTGAEAEAILERYRQSRLTQRVFAQRNGVSVSTLQYWLRRARIQTEENPRKARSAMAAPDISLLEVELAGAAKRDLTLGGCYEIELGSGVRLRLPERFSDGEVRRLLVLLKEVK